MFQKISSRMRFVFATPTTQTTHSFFYKIVYSLEIESELTGTLPLPKNRIVQYAATRARL